MGYRVWAQKLRGPLLPGQGLCQRPGARPWRTRSPRACNSKAFSGLEESRAAGLGALRAEGPWAPINTSCISRMKECTITPIV